MTKQGVINRSRPQAGMDGLEGRLFNWKFNQAIQYLEGQSKEVMDMVISLADLFGNVGWPVCDDCYNPSEIEEGLSRNEIILIRAAVIHLIGYNEF